jgi:hypothetical protein
MKLPSEHQQRMLLALTDEWQTTAQLGETAVKGAGTVLLALRWRGHAERREAATSATSGDGPLLESARRLCAATAVVSLRHCWLWSVEPN